MAGSYRHSMAEMATMQHLSPRSVTSDTSINACQWTLVGVAFILVCCRLYARCIRSKTFGLDDFCIMIAMGLSIFGGVCGTLFAHYGFGKHVWQLSPAQQSGVSKWLYISTLDSYIELFFVRLSIGLFTLRLLHNTRKKLRIAVYGILALNLANTIMVVVVYAIWCRPIQGVWNTDVKASCLSGTVMDDTNRVFAIISACIDLMLCLIPVSIIWQLRIDKATRINLTVLMTFGLTMSTCAILKAVYVDEKDPDFTYANVPVVYCAMSEDNVGIMVACLPGLRQFFFITRDDILIRMGKEPRRRTAKSSHSRSTHTQTPISPHTSTPVRTLPNTRGTSLTSQSLLGSRSPAHNSDTASNHDNYYRQNGSLPQYEDSIPQAQGS